MTNRSDQTGPVHDILFRGIDGLLIRKIPLRCFGTAGPSGIDAAMLKRLCNSFNGSSNLLFDALASFAKHLASGCVDPKGVASFFACRLISLNKNPGVQPIGVCKIICRVIGKAILSVVGGDIQSVTGAIQLCAGLLGVCDAAVYAMQKLDDDDDADTVLLVDATNAFYSLNIQTAFHNVSSSCPTIHTLLVNCY